jgi:hypothetical protein
MVSLSLIMTFCSIERNTRHYFFCGKIQNFEKVDLNFTSFQADNEELSTKTFTYRLVQARSLPE